MPKLKLDGGWEVIATVDSDNQLTISATHDSETTVYDVGEDLGDDKEFMIRVTCEEVEEEYRKSLDNVV